MKFYQALRTEKVKSLSHRKAVTVEKTMPFSEVIRKLQESKSGCAVVLDRDRVVGILTERDVLKRGILGDTPMDTPVERLMTPHPKVLDMEDTLAVAVRLMHDGKYRHLPVVDAEGKFLALLSVRDIVYFLSELYPYEVYNQPPDPHQISATAEGA